MTRFDYIDNILLLPHPQLLLNDTDGAFNFSGIFEAQGPAVSIEKTTWIREQSPVFQLSGLLFHTASEVMNR